jgi:hypothetical protein
MTFTMFVIEGEGEFEEFDVGVRRRYANVLEEEEFESDGDGEGFDGGCPGDLEGGTNAVPQGEEEDDEVRPWDPRDGSIFFSFI